MVALDLTNDHKPDLPEEKKRILAAGGTVTPAGPDGRPSRMYANGHVGLAMSRSLGDGLCKDYGCIPDPEIQHFSLKLPPKAGPQGEDGRMCGRKRAREGGDEGKPGPTKDATAGDDERRGRGGDAEHY